MQMFQGLVRRKMEENQSRQTKHKSGKPSVTWRALSFLTQLRVKVRINTSNYLWFAKVLSNLAINTSNTSLKKSEYIYIYIFHDIPNIFNIYIYIPYIYIYRYIPIYFFRSLFHNILGEFFLSSPSSPPAAVDFQWVRNSLRSRPRWLDTDIIWV